MSLQAQIDGEMITKNNILLKFFTKLGRKNYSLGKRNQTIINSRR
jgi:hypothetical protein